VRGVQMWSVVDHAVQWWAGGADLGLGIGGIWEGACICTAVLLGRDFGWKLFCCIDLAAKWRYADYARLCITMQAMDPGERGTNPPLGLNPGCGQMFRIAAEFFWAADGRQMEIGRGQE
jgi:hypothetical protein